MGSLTSCVVSTIIGIRAPVGVAPHRRDIRLLKEMGSNYIRISHYPQDDALLDTCDELGLLAWEEIPIIDLVPDTLGYADNCERNLREMIRNTLTIRVLSTGAT